MFLSREKVFGIVYNTQSESELSGGLKEVKSLVHTTPFFSPERLNFFQETSKIYNISCATQTKLSFLPLQPKKLTELELKPLSSPENKKLDSINYSLYTDNKEHKTLYKHLSAPALILVPELRFIEDIQSFLDITEEKITTWHSNLSQKEQFNRWLQIRNKEIKYIIGTRSAVFLPFQQLEEIIIDYEHKENHKHWDQSPRFHSLDIAKNLQKLHNCKLTLAGFSPSCRSYFNIYKKNYESESEVKKKIKSLSKNSPEIINMKQERKAGNYGIFSEQAKKELKNSNKDSFVFINRLGYSRVIGCVECGYTANCEQCDLSFVYHKEKNKLKCHYCNREQSVPRACPNCETQVVEHRGAGVERVEEKIKEIVNNKEIIRIDSKQEEIKLSSENKIIIGTEKALKYINWERTDLFLFINIDSQLRFPEFQTSEQVWQLIQEIQYYRAENSRFYIQSIKPDQLVLKSLKQPDRFYRMDLNSRRNLNYPPYKFLTRIFYGDKSEQKTIQEAKNLYSKLSEKLTQEYKTNIIISGPYEMHPKFYRNKYWQMILVKLPKESWGQEIKWLNKHIGSNWKVDPRPISILSP
ncbi:MAG: primosomal protein N' [Parcubacteria group bacterium QH_9_35_7]|nr:MAG: primosomal protein N' [Parcubacteria group bacterium QH_9_35_7]